MKLGIPPPAPKIEALHHPQTEGAVARLPIPVAMKDPFDGSRIPADMPMFRYYWRLRWPNGNFRFQYEIVGGQVIQTLFGKLPDVRGARSIDILDLFKTPDKPLFHVNVPDGAEPDILYQCAASMDGIAQPYRIYSFGWRILLNDQDRSGQCSGDYVHLHPAFEPPKILRSVNRVLSWSEIPKAPGSSY